MKKQKEYFNLPLESLQSLAGWAADCAERVLPIFEEVMAYDVRPRKALEGIREFASGGKRKAVLRKLAMDAYRASRETEDPAASAAAQAASLAAAAAYTHPLVDVEQTKHILGPAAYAALAREILNGDGRRTGDSEVKRAVEAAPPEVGQILGNMPRRSEGGSRVGGLMYDLDCGIRSVF